MWAVVKVRRRQVPAVDLALTVALCSAVGVLPRVGWLVALIILVMVALRVEQAEPWPETVVLAAGPMVIWFFAGMAIYAGV